MKRFVILLLLWLFFMPSAIAQKANQLPDAEVLKAANDSILKDAYVLYFYEKIAWILEDILADSQPTTQDEIAGWFPASDEEDENVAKGVFFNKEITKALFEASYNLTTGAASGKTVDRDLTPEEIEKINVRQTAFHAVLSLNAEDLPSCPEKCTFNSHVIPIDEDLYRVYYMLGTTQHGIIPFGCDFSYDCDSEGNIKGFRRYHKTYIPTQLKMDNGSPVVSVIHSHLKTCPLIAPTDIALYLLYGYEAGLSGFKVYSTTYNCVFSFDPEAYEINVEEI